MNNHKLKLYRIKSHYNARAMPCEYYIAEENKRKAKALFESMFNKFMKIYSVDEIESEKEQEDISTDFTRYHVTNGIEYIKERGWHPKQSGNGVWCIKYSDGMFDEL